jgi:chitodextrinase
MRTLTLLGVLLGLMVSTAAQSGPRIPASARNLLLDAKVSGNLESYDKGQRGAADHVVYDIQRKEFVRASGWHEYGVGFQQDLGVVPEEAPALWMAQWSKPVAANLIVLSGVYDNQPQPTTAWKIELHNEQGWTTLARGVGGWYDRGRYVWGGPGTEPAVFDALRVSVFSKDANTPIKSIHFRGEEGISWVVAYCPPIDAELKLPHWSIHAGRSVQFEGVGLLGDIRSWRWDFGDGGGAQGRIVNHAFDKPGTYDVQLHFSNGTHSGRLSNTVTVKPSIEARAACLSGPVMAGEPVEFSGHGSTGAIEKYAWDFGNGQIAPGKRVRHAFARPGIYQVKLTVADDKYSDDCLLIVRAHSEDTLRVPQVVLDTDQKNEQDDQHYLGYALFSELDILGVNSIHHGGGQEPINYQEILHIIDLAGQSGLPGHREPFIFRGANERLAVPTSRKWFDTVPIMSDASEAILAAARGAAPENPVWIVPVGPGTNVASAILQARAEGLELKGRMRVMWLGGSNHEITNEFNGNNDPWSMYVVAQSGVETWIMPAPVGARVRIDKRTEAHYYADHALGQYLKQITPAHNKPLFDPSCLSAIISLRLNLGWIKETEPVVVAGREQGYRWTRTDGATAVRVIRQIDQQAMKEDIFNTMKGQNRRLIGAGP